MKMELKTIVNEGNIGYFYAVARDMNISCMVEGPDHDWNYFVSPNDDADRVIGKMKKLGYWLPQ